MFLRSFFKKIALSYDPVRQIVGRPPVDAATLFLNTPPQHRIPLLRHMASVGFPMNQIDRETRKNALHFAAALQSDPTYSQQELVQLLMDLGVDPRAQDRSGSTPAHIAAKFGNVAALTVLHAAGVGFDQADDLGYTAVHQAVVNFQLEALDYLLSPSVSAPATRLDSEYLSPYGRALKNLVINRSGKLDTAIVERLEPFSNDRERSRLLYFFNWAYVNHYAIGYLTELGVHVEPNPVPVDGLDIHRAIARYDVRSIRELIASHYPIKEVDSNGNSIFHLAVQLTTKIQQGQSLIVSVLEAAPRDLTTPVLSIQNKNGLTPIQLAHANTNHAAFLSLLAVDPDSHCHIDSPEPWASFMILSATGSTHGNAQTGLTEPMAIKLLPHVRCMLNGTLSRTAKSVVHQYMYGLAAAFPKLTQDIFKALYQPELDLKPCHAVEILNKKLSLDDDGMTLKNIAAAVGQFGDTLDGETLNQIAIEMTFLLTNRVDPASLKALFGGMPIDEACKLVSSHFEMGRFSISETLRQINHQSSRQSFEFASASYIDAVADQSEAFYTDEVLSGLAVPLIKYMLYTEIALTRPDLHKVLQLADSATMALHTQRMDLSSPESMRAFRHINVDLVHAVSGIFASEPGNGIQRVHDYIMQKLPPTPFSEKFAQAVGDAVRVYLSHWERLDRYAAANRQLFDSICESRRQLHAVFKKNWFQKKVGIEDQFQQWALAEESQDWRKIQDVVSQLIPLCENDSVGSKIIRELRLIQAVLNQTMTVV